MQNVKMLIPEAQSLHQFMRSTKNPITVISVEKIKNVKECFEALKSLSAYLRIVVFVDSAKNDIYNSYMLIWRVTNNIDAVRDIFIDDVIVGVDATKKNEFDNFNREWPDDVECTTAVVERLKKIGVWDLSDEEFARFAL
jgi:4-hydroxy-3-polyprenylbenzoate decarboxylase